MKQIVLLFPDKEIQFGKRFRAFAVDLFIAVTLALLGTAALSFLVEASFLLGIWFVLFFLYLFMKDCFVHGVGSIGKWSQGLLLLQKREDFGELPKTEDLLIRNTFFVVCFFISTIYLVSPTAMAFFMMAFIGLSCLIAVHLGRSVLSPSMDHHLGIALLEKKGALAKRKEIATKAPVMANYKIIAEIVDFVLLVLFPCALAALVLQFGPWPAEVVHRVTRTVVFCLWLLRTHMCGPGRSIGMLVNGSRLISEDSHPCTLPQTILRNITFATLLSFFVFFAPTPKTFFVFWALVFAASMLLGAVNLRLTIADERDLNEILSGTFTIKEACYEPLPWAKEAELEQPQVAIECQRNMALGEKTLCQVCGDAMEQENVVYCDQCATPHHRDCWEYVGSCTTFGCPCVKYVEKM